MPVMATPFVRADIWSLGPNDPILTAYANAVAAMQARPATDPTSWAYQAAIHGSHSSTPRPEWNQCRHGSWHFVSWHRMYLYFFERIVRAQVIANGGPRTWALPYWDYDGGRGRNTLPPAFRTARRPDGSVNPLFVAQRRSAINSGAGLPSSITSPAFALSRTAFTGSSEFGGGIASAIGQFWSQTGRLEQTPHNDVHVAIGGLMGDPDSAAQDPIFWLHHCNIDRVWWLWEQQHSDPTDARWLNQSYSFMDAGGRPASLTAAGILDTSAKLHYTYGPSQTQVPSTLTWRLMTPAKWPSPWPEPTRSPQQPGLRAEPEPVADDARHLLGATDRRVRLVGNPLRTSIRIDERATSSLQASALAPTIQGRAFLDVEDIDAERNPGEVYGVYVNLPDRPTADDLNTHHVGNISLFGVERARRPRGDEHGHGLRVSMEITQVLDRLAAEGTWREGTRLDVTFRPITLEPSSTTAGVTQEVFSTDHADVPITIGRVSVHFV
jgi:tyrosinase